MGVGSERGTTHLDALYVDQLEVGGTIVGSVVTAGTENVTKSVETSEYIAGTITGSYGNITTLTSPTINSAGTITGSYGNISNVNAKGTVVGSYVNADTVNVVDAVNVAGSVVGSAITGSGFSMAAGVITGTTANVTAANVKGTITGSFIKGTLDGDFIGSSVKTNDMLFYTSGAIQVSTTAATCTHGLGTVPSVVVVTPNVISATGNVMADGANIGSAWFTVTANETGTATAYAWM